MHVMGDTHAEEQLVMIGLQGIQLQAILSIVRYVHHARLCHVVPCIHLRRALPHKQIRLEMGCSGFSSRYAMLFFSGPDEGTLLYDLLLRSDAKQFLHESPKVPLSSNVTRARRLAIAFKLPTEHLTIGFWKNEMTLMACFCMLLR